MNKVLLKGNCGSDPEVKTFDWGKVAKFSLATSESRKKDGEKITETTWHSLIFFGDVCDTLAKYVHKGDQLLVEGKIQTRTYKDKNDVDHLVTEIVCNSFEFCGSKESKEPKAETPQASGEWKGKKEVKAMSDISELPGNVANYDEIPDDPF